MWADCMFVAASPAGGSLGKGSARVRGTPPEGFGGAFPFRSGIFRQHLSQAPLAA